MRGIRLEGASASSVIAVGESLSRLNRYCDEARTIIVTDRVVKTLYGERLSGWPVIEIGAGETSKTLETVEGIYRSLLGLGVDRSFCLVGFGGGIVCDVTGFAASTYLRGLQFGFVPTTLLAQVDAAVGGKNGVNLDGYKNLIGTFTQPAFVLCDHDLLATLPEEELKNGFAEVIKEAAIADGRFFTFLEEKRQDALRLNRRVISRIVYDALAIKVAIVSADERESGERRKLNFGHTVGHAIEKVHGLSHGRAISLGIVAASRLSEAMGLMEEKDVRRIEELLSAFGLPVRYGIETGPVLDAIGKDKKREGEKIHFVLLDRIGKARTVPVTQDSLKGVIDDLRQPR